MNVTTNLVLVGLIGVLVGVGGTMVLSDTQERRPAVGWHMMSDGNMMDDDADGMQGMMDDMMTGLNGKTGDEFDHAFLEEMIVHHEGAVAMARAALQSAKHAEIKAMANAIISAQTTEITQMKGWEKSWYGN